MVSLCAREKSKRDEVEPSQTSIHRPSVRSHHQVLHLQVKRARSTLNVPDAGALVARARDEVSAVRRKVERVDLLRVPLEQVSDRPLGDVPNLMGSRSTTNESVRKSVWMESRRKTYSDLSVLSARSEEPSIGREADGTDVQISLRRRAFVLQHTARPQPIQERRVRHHFNLGWNV